MSRQTMMDYGRFVVPTRYLVPLLVLAFGVETFMPTIKAPTRRKSFSRDYVAEKGIVF